MYYFLLWNHPTVKPLSVADKKQAIKDAVSIFRKERNVDIQGRYLTILALALLPSAIVFINFSLLFALVLFSANCVLLELFLAKSEVPFIRDIIEEHQFVSSHI